MLIGVVTLFGMCLQLTKPPELVRDGKNFEKTNTSVCDTQNNWSVE